MGKKQSNKRLKVVVTQVSPMHFSSYHRQMYIFLEVAVLHLNKTITFDASFLTVVVDEERVCIEEAYMT